MKNFVYVLCCAVYGWCVALSSALNRDMVLTNLCEDDIWLSFTGITFTLAS